MKYRIQIIAKLFFIGVAVRWISLGCPGLKEFSSYWIGSDAFCYTGLLALMKEESWIPFTAVTSQRLSFPEGMAYPQWPMTDIFHWTTLHVMNLLSPSPVLAYNLYYVVGTGLITVTMGLLCLSLSLSWPLTLAISLIYAGLPFYFERLYHLFLAIYFQVPLIFYVLLNLRKQLSWKKSFLIGAIVGATGIYFAFFAMALVGLFFLIYAIFRREIKTPFRNCFSFGSGLLIVLVASLMSNWIYIYKNGGDPGTNQRGAHESLLWGMDFQNILLPPTSHWLPFYSSIRPLFMSWDRLYEMAPFEGYAEYLGLTAWIGLFICLLALVRRFRKSEDLQASVLFPLGGIALFCTLLAIKHGLGYWFAVFVSPQIRSWNRASIFIATSGILAFALWIQPLMNKYVAKKWTWVFCIALVVLSLGEQGTLYRPMVPAYDETSSDIAFSQQVKAIVGDKPVLGLPFGLFPDWRGYASVEPYANFRYLMFEKIHSVFPSIKGTPEADYKAHLFFGKLRDISFLLNYGIEGVVIDTADYKDNGREAISTYGRPGVKSVVSPNGRFHFFSLRSDTR